MFPLGLELRAPFLALRRVFSCYFASIVCSDVLPIVRHVGISVRLQGTFPSTPLDILPSVPTQHNYSRPSIPRPQVQWRRHSLLHHSAYQWHPLVLSLHLACTLPLGPSDPRDHHPHLPRQRAERTPVDPAWRHHSHHHRRMYGVLANSQH